MLCGAAVVAVNKNNFEDGDQVLKHSLVLIILIRYNEVNRYLDG
jgi:hypothetical protein